MKTTTSRKPRRCHNNKSHKGVNKSHKGVVAIEFAIGAATFFMMIFYWMEVSYMGFVSATVDFAVAESGRAARTGNSVDYEKLFKQALQNSDSLWAGFVDTDKFTVHISYFNDIGQLQGCGTNASSLGCQGDIKKDSDGNPIKNDDDNYIKLWEEHPLAIYRVEYPYQPLIAQTFFPSLNTLTISREVIAVQEYQRSAFQ